jgi:hypothetical protein
MWFKSRKEKDIDEIFSHVQKLKEEQNILDKKTDEINAYDVIQDNIGVKAGEISEDDIDQNDLFEVIGPVEEETMDVEEERTSIMKNETGKCDFCGQTFVLEENLAGLIINSEFFACEKCCNNASRKDIEKWCNNRMKKEHDVKPIALWLMEQKNKTTLFDK